MPSLNSVEKPVHSVKKRAIHSIDVIESWSLCFNLACAVKYIAMAGRKNPIAEDLKKAEWYLLREIDRYKESGEDCHLPLRATTRSMVNRICEDWNLSGHLGEVLDNIRASKISVLRERCLVEALHYLSAEINHQEFLQEME